MSEWIVRLEATIESDERPEPEDFYLDFNNNHPYSIIDESVEVEESSE